MAIYKIISTGNRILADQPFCEQHYPNDWEYEGEESEPIIPPKRILTKLEAMDRFTDEELEDIYTAAASSVAVQVWLEKFKAAQDTNLDDPRFIPGLDKLVTAGLLAPNRPAEILA